MVDWGRAETSSAGRTRAGRAHCAQGHARSVRSPVLGRERRCTLISYIYANYAPHWSHQGFCLWSRADCVVNPAVIHRD